MRPLCGWWMILPLCSPSFGQAKGRFSPSSGTVPARSGAVCVPQPGTRFGSGRCAGGSISRAGSRGRCGDPARSLFHAGLAGIGWAAAQLRKVLGLELDEVGFEIDMALRDHLEQGGWSATYDLIGGVVGVGAAALERLPNPAVRSCLDWIIGHLERSAEHCPAGITWWTDPAWLPPEDLAQYPRGYHDLSVAHGVPAVAALLVTAACKIQSERGRWLCERAVGWLQAQEAGYPSGLPYRVVPDGSAGTVAAPPSRLAWCQGDLGVAAVRMATASAAGRPDWADSAPAPARRAAGCCAALGGRERC